ncbi:hypothetical protein MUK42_34871 [Musa troglodytarum]|uniref:Uncharacterized protein n=1 Tax=Musa troglodytarum TaxID=320322 RepID=A0A9E7FCM7_9LILI|nr:hypothetical protein MUK42_34871 [Musa troglodytarum]
MGFFHEREKGGKDEGQRGEEEEECKGRNRFNSGSRSQEISWKATELRLRQVRPKQNHKELASLAASPDIPCLVLHVAISFPRRRHWRPTAALFLPLLEARFQAPIDHFFLFLRAIVSLRGQSPRPLQ